MRVQPLAAGFWMLAAAGAAALAIWLTTAWLLAVADDAPATDKAKIRVDAVRTGLAAGGGTGAAVGLMLAFRRQRHAELATALGQLDAAERRITELYNAAAEQLGSDKAPVRLTALYTLERLANDNPPHRQTIVNIICAYLRMPYSPPGEVVDGAREARQAARRFQAARNGRRPFSTTPEARPDPREEHQVRLTAQRILQNHLHDDADVPWADLFLDLTGATLVDFGLSMCANINADFREATFVNYVSFTGTVFSGPGDFSGASFTGFANFSNASFSNVALFIGASFSQNAIFDGASCATLALFGRASFGGDVTFKETSFAEAVNFSEASFERLADFSGASFPVDDVGFQGAFFAARRPVGLPQEVADRLP